MNLKNRASPVMQQFVAVVFEILLKAREKFNRCLKETVPIIPCHSANLFFSAAVEGFQN